jgi:hypothetical protein
MNVGQAKELARRWVIEEGAQLPGFDGAFFHGSITWLPDDAVLPESSDLDIMAVFSAEAPKEKIGKIRYRNVLLEVSSISREEVETANQILGHYHLAGSFRKPTIIADPSGHLAALQAVTIRDFAKRSWVERRVASATDAVRQRVRGIGDDKPFHTQAARWLFAAGGVPHILLAAGMRNPTVRKRYVAVRDLLEDYGLNAEYDPLLALIGAAEMTREQVQRHLDALAAAFDMAATVVTPGIPFAEDLAPDARSVPIDGSQELIDKGLHREALFWMVATYARCLTAIHAALPREQCEPWDRRFRALLADLGIASSADLQRGGEAIEASLPHVGNVAERIMTANPDVVE